MDRHVSFASCCVLIPEESPHQSGIFGLHTRSISLQLAWPHPKRSPSDSDDQLASPTAASKRPTTLAVRIPSFTSPKPHRNHSHSPTDSAPARSCIKQRNSSFSSTASPLIVPTRQRSVSSPQDTVPLRPCCPDCFDGVQRALSQGPAYKEPWSPTARAKKRRDDAEEKRDVLAGLKQGCIYKWAKLKEEEDSRIEDGLLSPTSSSVPSLTTACRSSQSPDICDPLSKLDGTHKSSNLRKRDPASNQEWAPSKYYDEQDDELDLFPVPSPSPRSTPRNGSPASSVIQLASPGATELFFPGPDSFSLPASPPPALSTKSNNNYLGLGLPTILSAPASRSASRSSVSSLSSSGHGHNNAQRAKPSPLRSSSSQTDVSDSGSHLSVNESARHPRHASDGSVQPFPKPCGDRASLSAKSTSSTISSSTSSSRTGSCRVWTSTFVPPPLPTKGSRHHRGSPPSCGASSSSKSALTPSSGATPSPLKVGSLTPAVNTLSLVRTASPNRAVVPTPSQPSVLSERRNPPPEPTYSGAQREVVVIKSSSRSSKRLENREGDASKARSREKVLPSLPPLSDDNGDHLFPLPPSSKLNSTASRRQNEGSSPSVNAPVPRGRSSASSRAVASNQGPEGETRQRYSQRDEIELASSPESSRPPVPTKQRQIVRSPSLSAFELPTFSRTSSFGSMALSRSTGSNDLVINRDGPSSSSSSTPKTNSRSASTDARGRPPQPPPSAHRRRPSESEEQGGKTEPRSRSSSIKKMFRGIGIGMGSAAGMVPVR